jgi:prophage DNA circulation protein
MQRARTGVFEAIAEQVHTLSESDQFPQTQAALVDVRTTAIAHMTAEGENLGRVFQTSCCDGTGWQKHMPAIVVAYRHYRTLTDEVIALRNKLVSPLFIEPHAQIELVAL